MASTVDLLYVLLVCWFSGARSQNCTYGNYVGLEQGMVSWPITCAQCDSDQQSPIDLSVSSAQAPPSGQLSSLTQPFSLKPSTSWDSLDFKLMNSGQKVVLMFDSGTIAASGLGLPAIYYVAEVHWHWGETSTVGSEHTRNTAAYAMEGHMVMYNSAFANFAAALGQPDGIAVVAIWYDEKSMTDNSVMAPIVSNLANIQQPFSFVNFDGFNVANFLPSSTFSFFRYMGSLTTPSCDQNVLWTVIDSPVSLSVYQMIAFRTSVYFSDLFGYGEYIMVNNFRLLQLLNGRTVYYVRAASSISLPFNQLSYIFPMLVFLLVISQRWQ